MKDVHVEESYVPAMTTCMHLLAKLRIATEEETCLKVTSVLPDIRGSFWCDGTTPEDTSIVDELQKVLVGQNPRTYLITVVLGGSSQPVPEPGSTEGSLSK